MAGKEREKGVGGGAGLPACLSDDNLGESGARTAFLNVAPPPSGPADKAGMTPAYRAP